MENRINDISETISKIQQRYLLAEKIDQYVRYARKTDVQLEKEANQAGLYVDDRIFEQFSHLGGELSGLRLALSIIKNKD